MAGAADLRRMDDLQILASLQPLRPNPATTMARLGPERAKALTDLAAVRRAGVPLSFGSDAPDALSRPFAMLAALGGKLPPALAGLSTAAAYAGHAEAEVGRLGVGLYADFLLLDRDPFAGGGKALPKVVVLETWLSGNRVYQRGQDSGSEAAVAVAVDDQP